MRAREHENGVLVRGKCWRERGGWGGRGGEDRGGEGRGGEGRGGERGGNMCRQPFEIVAASRATFYHGLG